MASAETTSRDRLSKLLRWSWSAICLIACTLLIAMWIRSYFKVDGFFGPLWGQKSISTISVQGEFGMCLFLSTRIDHFGLVAPSDNREDADWFALPRYCTRLGFRRTNEFGYGPIAVVPYWFLCAIPATLGVIPWIPWSRRFSIRTMLIITTLLAILCGLYVLSNSRPAHPPSIWHSADRSIT